MFLKYLIFLIISLMTITLVSSATTKRLSSKRDVKPIEKNQSKRIKTRVYSGILRSAQEVHIMSSKFGKWQTGVMCPNNTFATGFQIRSPFNFTGIFADPTGIIGIRLICNETQITSGNEELASKITLRKSISSMSASEENENPKAELTQWAVWGDVKNCGKGERIVGYQIKGLLKKDRYNNFGGIMGIVFYCYEPTSGNFSYINDKHRELPFGNWTLPKFCPEEMAICGFRAHVDYDITDPVGYNNIEAYCCDHKNRPDKASHRQIKGVVLKSPNLNLTHFLFSSLVGNNRIAGAPENFFILGMFDYPFWAYWSFCPEKQYVTGIQLNMNNGYIHGVKLTCTNPLSPDEKSYISSGTSDKNNYGDEINCNGGTVLGFQVLQNNKKGIKNIRLFCSFSKTSNVPIGIEAGTAVKQLEYDDSFYYEDPNKDKTVKGWDIKFTKLGMNYFKWTIEKTIVKTPQLCPSGTAVCGFKLNSGAKPREGQGPIDFRMKCCYVPHPAETCVPWDDRELIFECDATKALSLTQCSYAEKIGYSLATSKSEFETKERDFQESIRDETNSNRMRTLSFLKQESEEKRTLHSVVHSSETNSRVSEGTSFNKFESENLGDNERNTMGSTDMESYTNTFDWTESDTHTQSQSSSKTRESSSNREWTKGQTSSHTTGVSSSVTAGVSAKAGAFGVEVSSSVSATLSANFEHSRSSGSSRSSSQGQSSREGSSNSRQDTNTKERGKGTSNTGGTDNSNTKTNTFGKENSELLDNTNTRDKATNEFTRQNNNTDNVSAIGSSSGVSTDEMEMVGVSQDKTESKTFKTGYDWSKAQSETFNEEKMHTSTIYAPPGTIVKVYQVVGYCSYYTVKTSRLDFKGGEFGNKEFDSHEVLINSIKYYSRKYAMCEEHINGTVPKMDDEGY